jgi:hypothetical protein
VTTGPETTAADPLAQIAAMREREAAATRGPWLAEDSGDCWQLFGAVTPGIHPLQLIKAPKCGTPYAEYWPDDADAVFIAAARSDMPRLLAGYEALLKLHQPKQGYGPAFSPSSGAPLCSHDPDTDTDAHFEGDDGEWYCRDKITGRTCRTCADEENADLWAEWPCATYDAIAAALAGGEVPSS